MPIKSLANERILLQQIAEGNEKAFATLFNAYNNQLAEYIISLTASEEMTEEIILDIFVKIWSNKLELPGVENFPSYVFILTRNYTLNAIRKAVNDRKNHMVYTLHLAEEELQFFVGVEEHKDYSEVIEKAVSQLPPQQQKVFVLKQKGKKNGEIASELGISSESARKYYQWAVKSVASYVKSHIEVAVILACIGILNK